MTMYKGVDTIATSFDQQEHSMQSLGLHKDLRPFKMKYRVLYATVLPLAISIVTLLGGLVFSAVSELLFAISLAFLFGWKRSRLKFLNSEKSIFDEPKYLEYTEAASVVDYSPKEMNDDVKAVIRKVKDSKNRAKALKNEKDPGKAVYFLGHELNTNQEIHITDDKFRTHLVIFGTTGSGKTETILSICVNFLIQSSGFILVDGKGDTLLFSKIFSIAQAFLRTDDLYLLNFMDEVKSLEKRVERISNTFNFLVETTASEANEIIGGLLPGDSKGGGMWEGRASAGIAAINKTVYYLKENGFIDLDPETYRTYFDLKEFAALSMDTNVPKEYRGDLRAVLASINYKLPTAKEPNPQQASATEEQFQYIVMQFTSTFNMLAGDYRHICVSQCPDISITDVVLRRRILLVLLPSLAKSPNNVKNLGRIVISMTRNVSSKAIGARVEGGFKEVIESKPTAAINSFALIFDEYGTYATAGAEQLPAQVRSLNLVCLFAGQDYQAFKKGDPESAATIFANCTLKICMKLEDPDETFERFVKSAGEEYVMVADQYEVKETMFGRKYLPEQRATVQKKPVLDVKDLKAQLSGWATFIYGSRVIRYKSFYADPKMVQKMRILHMLQVKSPKTPKVRAAQNALDKSYKKTINRIQGSWKTLRMVDFKVHSLFSEQYVPINSVIKRVDEAIERSGSVMRPSDTEKMLFAMMLFMRRVSLIDKQIEQEISKNLGVETQNHVADDCEVLKEISETSSDTVPAFQFPPAVADSLVPQNFRTQPQVAQTSNDKHTTEPVKDNQATASNSPSHNVVDEQRKVDFKSIFDKMNMEIQRKRAILEQPRNPNFDAFKAMSMDAFAVQDSVRQVEELILRKNGVSGKDAQIASALTARALVVDINMKTNVAIITDGQQKSLSPSRSSRQVKSVIEAALQSVNGTN